MKLLAVIDTETTGLQDQDELIELAVLVFEYNDATATPGAVVRSYQSLREPSVPVRRAAQALHGLSRRKLKGHRIDEESLRATLTGVEALIAHNAAFDRRFVEGVTTATHGLRWLCSLRSVDWAEWVGRASLAAIAEHHQLPASPTHRALDDARTVLAALGLSHPRGGTILSHVLRSPDTPAQRRSPSTQTAPHTPSARADSSLSLTSCLSALAWIFTIAMGLFLLWLNLGA